MITRHRIIGSDIHLLNPPAGASEMLVQQGVMALQMVPGVIPEVQGRADKGDKVAIEIMKRYRALKP